MSAFAELILSVLTTQSYQYSVFIGVHRWTFVYNVVSILNIIIDPIFIYTLGYGVTGAAYATILSMFLSTLILIYWLFFRKDTYVDFNFINFKFNKEIIKDIFKVGLPASVQQLSMSVTMLILIIVITILIWCFIIGY